MRALIFTMCLLLVFTACAPQTYSTRPTETPVITNQVTSGAQTSNALAQTQSSESKTVQTPAATLPGNCTDTDEGNVPTKKGTVTFAIENNRTSTDDSCLTKEILLERYCQLGQMLTEKVVCPKGCVADTC